MVLNFFSKIHGYRLAFSIIIILSILVAVVDMMSITALIPVSESMIGKSNDILPWPLSAIVDVTGGGPYKLLFFIGVMLLIKVFFNVLNVVLTSYVKLRMWNRWARGLVEQQLYMPYREWLGQDSGNLINLSTRELINATSFFASYASLLTQVFSFVMLVGAMILVDWRVVVIGFFLGVAIYFLLRPVNRLAQRNGELGVQYARSTASIISETIQGGRDIRLLRAETRRLEEVGDSVALMTRNDFQGRLLQEIPTNGAEVLLGVLLVALGFIVGAGDDSGRDIVSLPTLLFFLVSLFRLSVYAANVSSIWVKLVKRYPSFLAVVNALRAPGDTHDDGEFTSVCSRQEVEAWRPRFGFSLTGLTFAHTGQEVLRKVDLDLPLGSVTYLYGASGSGKSSIADVLARLHEPGPGALFLDGKDASDVPMCAWRGLIGYVPQEPVLFSGTMLENLRVGCPGASREDVAEALAKAGAEEFSKDMLQGRDAVLLERGRNLSGGQRCRLAIARALLRKPSLLILDESLGGVEISLEKDIMARLRAIEGLGVLVISHRKESAVFADQVAVLDGGMLSVTKELASAGVPRS